MPNLNGKEREAMEECPVCDGRGWKPLPYIKEDPRHACKCERCDGTGKVISR